MTRIVQRQFIYSLYNYISCICNADLLHWSLRRKKQVVLGFFVLRGASRARVSYIRFARDLSRLRLERARSASTYYPRCFLTVAKAPSVATSARLSNNNVERVYLGV